MDKEDIIKKYCNHCKNQENGKSKAIYLCLECWYDMRYFKDNRIVKIEKNKLKNILDRLYYCCEQTCDMYHQCQTISDLDDLYKEIWG